ncbi:MAG: type II and III secretion system protein family protein [Caulobacteraceae bacterium]|nr:type II and III secretion system protein family protein [Caulobacteraceae bacterium]
MRAMISQGMRPRLRRALIAASFALIAWTGTGSAQAQTATADQEASRSIFVPKDKSAGFHLDYPVSELVVAQPEMLQVVATTDHSFYLRGKAVGSTNLLIYDKQHRLTQVLDVRIGQDIGSLREDLKSALPNERIIATSFAGGVMLSGVASTSLAATRAAAIAEHYAPKGVSNTISIQAAQQIRVDVRVIEARRSALKDMGFNITGSNAAGLSFSTGSGLVSGQAPQGSITIPGHFGGTSIDVTLDALEQKGVVRTLAKPNLVAMSGEEASFLAGGEFPYPVPNGISQVTVEFRQFGVKLNVTPVIEDNGQIKLKVAPEVSQLDTTHSVKIDNFNLPSLTISRAATTVELRDGQSFAIAGLFQQGYNNTVNQVPWLADLPVLGTLFRSADWQRQQTELVIIVTPHLTTPSDRIEDIPNPLMAHEEPSSIDLILSGLIDRPVPKAPKKTKGAQPPVMNP